MTFMIILGGVAALYLIVLIFRLAAIALPLYAAIGTGLWMLDRGFGYGASIVSGLCLGALILLAGRLLCAALPPLWRGVVALLFALPAGFAGYQAARGVAGLALSNGEFLECLAITGALITAAAAWRSLGAPQDARPETGAPLGAIH